MKNILEVRNLNKSYKHFSLQDISFSLPEGCITGFIGVNGAGKTTTLKTILGLTSKDSGEIRFFDMNMDTEERHIKERLGVVFDSGGFYAELTLQEMKALAASSYRSWDEKEFRRYLERFSLNPRQKINTLSKGMRMKYALALALSHQADFLVMDEPTSGLDPLIRRQLLDILREYMERGGRGVFFSTHITSDLDQLADMLVLIDHGKIVFQEEKDSLLERYRIVKGDVQDLSDAVLPLLHNLSRTAFGFTAVTDQAGEIQKAMPGAFLERASIEDIMLCRIEGVDKYAASAD